MGAAIIQSTLIYHFVSQTNHFSSLTAPHTSLYILHRGLPVLFWPWPFGSPGERYQNRSFGFTSFFEHLPSSLENVCINCFSNLFSSIALVFIPLNIGHHCTIYGSLSTIATAAWVFRNMVSHHVCDCSFSYCLLFSSHNDIYLNTLNQLLIQNLWTFCKISFLTDFSALARPMEGMLLNSLIEQTFGALILFSLLDTYKTHE